MHINKQQLLKNLYFVISPTDEKEQMRSQTFSGGKHEETKYFAIDKDYEIYFLNFNDEDIKKAQMLTGGFASDESTYIETSKTFKEFALYKNQLLKIETLDYGMLDFVNWYHFDLWVNKEFLQVQVTINKANQLNDKFANAEVPLLGKKGFVIPLEIREGKSISEEIKEIDMGSKHKNNNDVNENQIDESKENSTTDMEFTLTGEDAKVAYKAFFGKNGVFNNHEKEKSQKNKVLPTSILVMLLCSLLLTLVFIGEKDYSETAITGLMIILVIFNLVAWLITLLAFKIVRLIKKKHIKIGTKYLVIGGVLILLIGSIYWFEVRPSNIRKSCAQSIRGKGYTFADANNMYRLCLTQQGIKPDSLFVNTSN